MRKKYWIYRSRGKIIFPRRAGILFLNRSIDPWVEARKKGTVPVSYNLKGLSAKN
jgi:hypothetical protein